MLCRFECFPVGEVFTSPKLKGTNGVLYVSEIYLYGWKFVDLLIKIKDGMVSEYSCKNYPTEKENEEYINEHLMHYRSLGLIPMHM